MPIARQQLLLLLSRRLSRSEGQPSLLTGAHAHAHAHAHALGHKEVEDGRVLCDF